MENKINLGDRKTSEKIDRMFDLIDLIYRKLTENEIKVWFNGTFGVSAYYGYIFDEPRDVDCGVMEKDFDEARRIIENLGYTNIENKENEKFKVSIYRVNDFNLEIGTFEQDLGDKIITLEKHELRVPDAKWLAECYRITAQKEEWGKTINLEQNF